MLTSALLAHPETPGPLVAALADRARAYALTYDQVRALAAHPNLPPDHPALGDGSLRAALNGPRTPPDRARAIAAALPALRLLGLLAAGPVAPDAPERVWVTEPGPTHAVRVATCPSTPAPTALDALQTAIRGARVPFPPERTHALAWAAARFPDRLHDLARDAVGTRLGTLLAATATSGNPRAFLLGAMTQAATAGDLLWDELLDIAGDAAAHTLLTAPHPPGLQAVLTSARVSGPLRARALVAGLQHTPHLIVVPDDVAAIADHLDDRTLASLLAPDRLPAHLWAPALTCPDISAGTLALARTALATTRHTTHVPARVAADILLTIAAHPATLPADRAAALAQAGVCAACTDDDPTPIRQLHATVNVITCAPTRVPLPRLRLDDGTAGDGPDDHPAITNLTRMLTAALTPGLHVLTDPAAAAAAQLAPTFTGNWDQLVQVATTITG